MLIDNQVKSKNKKVTEENAIQYEDMINEKNERDRVRAEYKTIKLITFKILSPILSARSSRLSSLIKIPLSPSRCGESDPPHTDIPNPR